MGSLAPLPGRSFPTETYGTNSPAGNCLSRLLPAEGLGRSLISNLEVLRARVRGKTSAGEGAAVTVPLTVPSGIPSSVMGLHPHRPGP